MTCVVGSKGSPRGNGRSASIHESGLLCRVCLCAWGSGANGVRKVGIPQPPTAASPFPSAQGSHISFQALELLYCIFSSLRPGLARLPTIASVRMRSIEPLVTTSRPPPCSTQVLAEYGVHTHTHTPYTPQTRTPTVGTHVPTKMAAGNRLVVVRTPYLLTTDCMSLPTAMLNRRSRRSDHAPWEHEVGHRPLIGLRSACQQPTISTEKPGPVQYTVFGTLLMLRTESRNVALLFPSLKSSPTPRYVQPPSVDGPWTGAADRR